MYLLSSLDGIYKLIAMIFLAFIPYYWSYLKKVIDFFKKNTNRMTIIQKKDKSTSKPLRNFTFTAISWYITREHLEEQNDIFCEKDEMQPNDLVRNNSGSFYKIIPLYEPNTGINIKYKEFNIKLVFKRYDDEKHIILEGDKSILKEFTDSVVNQYWEYLYKPGQDNELTLYTWEDDQSYSQTGFQPCKISINKTFDNIFLKNGMIDSIKQDIDSFINNKEIYNKLGIPYKRGYLFYGPPGTGKSSTVFAIARETNRNIYKLNVKNFTEKDIIRAIKTIPPKSLILIEEIDVHIYSDRNNTNEQEDTNEKVEDKENVTNRQKSITSNNTSKNTSNNKKMGVSVLMDIFDGYEYLYDCIIILTTNKKDAIEPALIRPGRIDVHYYFDKVNNEDIEHIVYKLTSHKISLKTNILLSTSHLINTILLPHINDKDRIIQEICNIKTKDVPSLECH